MKKEKETEDIDIDLRSEEFQDVLGKTPPWILRWGITILGFIVLSLLIGSAIFKYPDTLTSAITLTGRTPTAAVVARSSGKLQSIRVEDNDPVSAGDLLAVIDNPAKTEDVIFLKEYLEAFVSDVDSLQTFELPRRSLELGDLQSVFSSFYLALFEYEEFIRQQYYSQKIEIVKNRIAQYENQYQSLCRQRDIVFTQTGIAEQQYHRDSALQEKGIISQETLEQSQSQYLQGKLSYENMTASLDNANIQIVQLKEQLLDTEHQYIEKKNTLENQIKNYYSQLYTGIQSWELNYALIAPVEGKITFTNYWSPNQNVVSGESIFHIVPQDSCEIIGKAYLPINRSGKVQVGQKVHVRFESFPDNEYGIVRGVVRNISLVPFRYQEFESYVIEVELPEGLKTTYNKELPFLPEMRGSAEIITDDISLLQRFFMPIKKILSERI